MRLFGHPLHTQVNHFHLALLPSGVVFEVLARWLSVPDLSSAALYAWALGYVGLVASVVTGLPDLLRLAGSAARTGLLHAALGSALLLLFGLALWARLQGAGDLALVLALVGTGVTLFTSWVGGQLVYVHGAGVRPTASVGDPGAYTRRGAP